MKVVDINSKITNNEEEEEVSLFENTIVFNPEEVRQYLFMI